MDRDEYRRVSTGAGQHLRNVLRVGLDRAPRKSHVLAALNDAGVTDPAERERLAHHVAELAERVRAGEDIYSLHQVVDSYALDILDTREAADQILDPEPVEQLDDATAHQVVDRIRDVDGLPTEDEWRRAEERQQLAKLRTRG